jgi:predicted PilT family ATPase
MAIVVPVVLASANKQIALRPSKTYPAAKGTAQYQAQSGQHEIQLEVEHVRSLAGQRVSFYVGGSKIGTARVSKRGVADIDRNTDRGQRVSPVGAGTTVRVRTSGSVLIVSGKF